MPEVWSPQRRLWLPMSEWGHEKQERLMVGTHHYRPLIAKVLEDSEPGRVWRCRIWQQSAPPFSSDTVDSDYQDHWFEADVIVANLSETSKHLPPVDEYITVIELPDADGGQDNDFVYVLNEIPRIARTTSIVTAGTATEAGDGTANLIEFEPGEPYSVTDSVTVYNTNDEIADDKVIQVKRIEGYWFVDVARCP